jgi:hypothetical protein
LWLSFISTGTSTAQTANLDSVIHSIQSSTQRIYEEISKAYFSGSSEVTVYFGVKALDFNLIPIKMDYYFEGYWQKPDSLQIVVKALRKVEMDSNDVEIDEFGGLPNPFNYLFNPSALGAHQEKNIRDKNVWPIHPFAAGADSVYRYKYVGKLGFGENEVLAIRVEPTREVPATIGTYFVDPQRLVVVGSDVTFNKAASFLDGMGVENHQIRTKKNLLYSQYWFPGTVEEEFNITIWGMKAQVHRTIKFDSYLLEEDTPPNPDQPGKVIYDRDPELEKQVFTQQFDKPRLTRADEEALYRFFEERIKSLHLESGLLSNSDLAHASIENRARQEYERYLKLGQRVGQYFSYNRVEGPGLSYGVQLRNPMSANSIFSARGRYGIEDKKPKFEIGLLKYFGYTRRLFVDGTLHNTIAFDEDSDRFSKGKNTLSSLVAKSDYHDYYYKKGGELGLGYRFSDKLVSRISFIAHEESEAQVNTGFSLIRNGSAFRSNPEILEGRLHAITGAFLYRAYAFDVSVATEWSTQRLLNSDFTYRLLDASVIKEYRTTYNSKVRLDLSAGIAGGQPPPQRWFDFGGRSFLNFNGNLRGVGYKAFTGDRMVTGIASFQMNGNALYDRGLRLDALKMIKVTLWTGHAWSRLSSHNLEAVADLNVPVQTTEGWYREVGLAISDRLNLLRLDLVRNNLGDASVRLRLSFLR